MHTAMAALDDDDSTFWSPGRNPAFADLIAGRKPRERLSAEHTAWMHEGWLEVDLGSPAKVGRALVKEHNYRDQYSPVASWKIEYEKDGVWHTAAEGEKIGKSLDIPFATPVNACKFKLTITAPGRPAISEFQLFQ
jgi:hypothetical protein